MFVAVSLVARSISLSDRPTFTTSRARCASVLLLSKWRRVCMLRSLTKRWDGFHVLLYRAMQMGLMT